MKKILLFFKLFFFTSCFAQLTDINISKLNVDTSLTYRIKWATHNDTTNSLKVQKNAFIVGTSDDFLRNSPILYINQIDSGSLNICLAYWPVDICSGCVLYFKFDTDSKVYGVTAKYSSFPFKYTLMFDKVLEPTITFDEFLYKLKTNDILYTRLVSNCVLINVVFILNGVEESLKIFEK